MQTTETTNNVTQWIRAETTIFSSETTESTSIETTEDGEGKDESRKFIIFNRSASKG